MLITKGWQIYWSVINTKEKFWETAFHRISRIYTGNQLRCGLFWVCSTSKLCLVSSTPGDWNFTEYTVQYWQNFGKSSKHLSSNKMIWQKIAAYTFGTKIK